MPFKTSHVVAPGTFAQQEQPSIPVPGGLLIRPWTPLDAPAVYEAFQDPLLQRWHARVADSVAEAGEWIDGWIKAWPEERHAYWAVADTATDAVVARVALHAVALADGGAEVAYWTMPFARGRGVITRAVTALADWCFDEVGLHRLELTHSVDNEASCRVAAKTGFAYEGTRRSSLLHEDGWHDMHLHGLVRKAG